MPNMRLGRRGGKMQKKILAVLALVAVLAFAAYSGFRDGAEHRAAPAGESDRAQ